MDAVLKVALEALITVLVVAIPLGAKYVIQFLNTKTAVAKEQAKSENEVRLLNSINTTIEESVNFVSQTFVDSLKNEGEFSKDKQIIALQYALSTIQDGLTEEAKEFIMSNYGDMTAWLTTKVESTIKINKN